ncbi:hypothetical protein SISNIDRAFT_420753 [Sistotremastrum niveocremeum HHB9708]|uniref:Uncharacterized protein n=1 Tax=Sistotremastrum niveocremeum HHB9708 TaxID=1314777 RepID=A0A164MBE0_9AGAM|nr:hypothetical protein SISNIDRAFT_420753 [Sistotremastrum niveocremeum HHB9708]
MPKAFTPEGILRAVAVHIVCNNEPFMLADKATFRNILVAMRPKTKKKEIPSRYLVQKYIDDEFEKYMVELKESIIVSSRVFASVHELIPSPPTSRMLQVQSASQKIL